MTRSTKVEEDVYSRLKSYCEENGMKIQYATSRAVEDYLDEHEEDGGEE